MNITIWFGVFFLAAGIMLLVVKKSNLNLVSHAAVLHKTWSMRLNAIAFSIGGWLVMFPDAALHAWNLLPADIKSELPENTMQIISYVLIGASMLSQYVKQTRLAGGGK